jgi:hypothetical protein
MIPEFQFICPICHGRLESSVSNDSTAVIYEHYTSNRITGPCINSGKKYEIITNFQFKMQELPRGT